MIQHRLSTALQRRYGLIGTVRSSNGSIDNFFAFRVADGLVVAPEKQLFVPLA